MKSWNIYRAGRLLRSVTWDQDYVRADPSDNETVFAANRALCKTIALGAEVVLARRIDPFWAMESRLIIIRRAGKSRGTTYGALPPLDLIFDLSSCPGFSAEKSGAPLLFANHEVLTRTMRCFQGSPADPYAPSASSSVELDLADPLTRSVLSREFPEAMVATDFYLENGRPDGRVIAPRQPLTFAGSKVQPATLRIR